MNFPTLRDAEIAFSRLERELQVLKTQFAALNTKKATPTASPVKVIQVNSSSPQIDIDSNNDNGVILHNLKHRFLNGGEFTDAFVNGALVLGAEINKLGDFEYWRWERQTLNSVTFSYSDTASGEQFAAIFTTGATLDAANIAYLGSIGNDIFRVAKISLANLSVLANTPAVGDVLTAVDTDGNVEWAAATADTNNYKQAAASGSLSLTTTYQDITGATVTLDQNGYWLIIATFYFAKIAGDDICQGRIDWAGTPQSPTAYFGEAVGTTGTNMRSSVTISKIIQVTSQPDIVKLQAAKNAGAGSSVVASGDTHIQAVFLRS